jgi:O-Antigen ligase
MRFVAIALILASLPIFLFLLQQYRHRRDVALIALGFFVFCGGNLQIDAAFISWPLWSGTVRGIQISPVDTLAIALIMTRKHMRLPWPFIGFLLLYGATILVSITVASVPLASAFSLIQLLRAILIFVAIAGEWHHVGARSGLMAGLSLGLILQAAYVINQKLSGVVQATGTMYHQNVLGMMAELALLPLIAAALSGDRRKLVYAGIAGGFIVIAGGGSRGAMGIVFGAVLLLPILSVIRRRTAHKMRLIGVGAIGMAIAVPLGLATLQDRFGDTPFTTQEQQRAAFERAATAMAKDHFFGVGANLYVPVANLEGYADKAGVAWNQANRSAPVHNAYLLARAETGRLGELALLLMLIVPALMGLRFAFSHRRASTGDNVLGASIALLAVGVHNLYEFAAHTYHPQILILINIAIISGSIRSMRLAKASEKGARATSKIEHYDADTSYGTMKARGI